MNVHWLQHVPFEGLGCIEPWGKTRGHRITATRFYKEEPLPPVDCVDWLIVMGGPMNIYSEGKYPWLVREKRFIEEAIKRGKVVIGICLGAQLIADVLGAKIYANPHKEIGWFLIEKTVEATKSGLFSVCPAEMEVFHWHGDTFDLPTGAMRMARSVACENQAFVYDERVVGLQFHLEIMRQDVERIIENCANEIIEGPFIQTPDLMLSEGRPFGEMNATMEGLLDQLKKATV